MSLQYTVSLFSAWNLQLHPCTLDPPDVDLRERENVWPHAWNVRTLTQERVKKDGAEIQCQLVCPSRSEDYPMQW